MSLKTEEALKKGKKEGCEALKIHLPHIQIQHNKYLRTYHAPSAEVAFAVQNLFSLMQSNVVF